MHRTAEIPPVLPAGGSCAGEGCRGIKTRACVADVAVDVGGDGAPSGVVVGVGGAAPGSADGFDVFVVVDVGELVSEELLGAQEGVHDCGREGEAVVLGVAEDGGDFDEVAFAEVVVGVVFDEVVVEGWVPEVQWCRLCAWEGSVHASDCFLEIYGVDFAHAFEVGTPGCIP